MKKLLLILAFLPLFSFGQYQTTNLDELIKGIEVVGSDTLGYDTILGTGNSNYKFIYVDFDITKDSFPVKSDAYLIMYSDTIPLSCLNSDGLRNYNRADTTFIQQSNNNVLRIAHYTSATIDVNDYFNQILLGTGVINVPNDYSTISAAITASSANDTIEVESGIYDETNFLYWRDQNIRGIGDVELRSSGTSYVILASNETNVFMSGIDINGEGNTGRCILGSAAFNNKDVYNCNFRNAITDIVRYSTTSLQTIDLTINNSVFVSEPEFEIQTQTSFYGCYFKNQMLRSLVIADSVRFENCLFRNTIPTSTIISLNSTTPENLFINGNTFEDIKANTVLAANSGVGNCEIKNNTVTTDSIIAVVFRPSSFSNIEISGNNIINNSYTVVSDILIENFDSCYIRDNIFKTETGNMYPINVASTSLATELYVERNIDSSKAYQGYFIRVGPETTGSYDNNILKTVIRYNSGFGQKYFYLDSMPTSHGILLGFQSYDIDIFGNEMNGFGLNYVLKGSTGTYSNNTKTSYNLSANSYSYGFYSKGLDSLNLYNNTSYNDKYAYYFTINTGSDAAIHCSVVNSIIQGTNSQYAYVFDASSSNNFNSNNNIIYGQGFVSLYNSTNYNFANWQALTYDSNSSNLNPILDASFTPTNTQIKGKAFNLGVDYKMGLDPSATIPDNIVLKSQFTDWTAGWKIPNLGRVINTNVRIIYSKGILILF